MYYSTTKREISTNKKIIGLVIEINLFSGDISPEVLFRHNGFAVLAFIKNKHRGKTIGYGISGMLAIAASTGLRAWGHELRVADCWLSVMGDNKLAFDRSPMTIYLALLDRFT